MPDLEMNLLSMYQMTHWNNQESKIYLKLCGYYKNIYRPSCCSGFCWSWFENVQIISLPSILPRDALLSHANETIKLWHERYGHLNYMRFLQARSKESMVEGIPTIKVSNGTWKGCVVGKHSELKYKKSKAMRVVQVLDLIHSYLIGPLPTPLYGN